MATIQTTVAPETIEKLRAYVRAQVPAPSVPRVIVPDIATARGAAAVAAGIILPSVLVG